VQTHRRARLTRYYCDSLTRLLSSTIVDYERVAAVLLQLCTLAQSKAEALPWCAGRHCMLVFLLHRVDGPWNRIEQAMQLHAVSTRDTESASKFPVAVMEKMASLAWNSGAHFHRLKMYTMAERFLSLALRVLDYVRISCTHKLASDLAHTSTAAGPMLQASDQRLA